MKTFRAGMLFFLRSTIASFRCYDGLDTAVIPVSIHSDVQVLEDIQDYMNSTTDHRYSPREAAEYFFGNVFDNANSILEKFDVQVLADYRNLVVNVEGCFEGVAQEKGSEFLSEAISSSDLKGIHLLLIKCAIEDSAVFISGKCGRLIVLTHTFATDLEKRVKEQLLRALGSSPRLKIDRPVFDTKFTHNICSFLDTCVEVPESDESKLLEGIVKISNQPTSRSRFQDLNEAILEEFDGAIDQILGREKSTHVDPLKSVSPLKKLEYLDLKYISNAQKPTMTRGYDPFVDEPFSLPLQNLQGKINNAKTPVNTTTYKRPSSLRRSGFLSNHNKSPLSTKRRSQLRKDNSSKKTSPEKISDKASDNKREHPVETNKIPENPLEVISTSPLFSKNKPSRPLMAEDLLIPEFFSQNQDKHSNKLTKRKGDPEPVLDHTKPLSPETKMVSEILEKTGKVPTDEPLKKALAEINKPTKSTSSNGMFLLKNDPMESTNEVIEKFNQKNITKIEPLKQAEPPFSGNPDDLVDGSGAFITKDNKNLPPGHFPGDPDELLEKVTTHGNDILPSSRISIKHDYHSSNLGFLSHEKRKSLKILENMEFGQSFNTPEERMIYIRTRSNPDFNPSMRKHKKGLLLSDLDDSNQGSLGRQDRKITWSRSAGSSYKKSSSMSDSQKFSSSFSKASNRNLNSSGLRMGGGGVFGKSGLLNKKLGSSGFSSGYDRNSLSSFGSKGLSTSARSSKLTSASKFSGNIDSAVSDLQTAKNQVDSRIKDLRKTAMGNDPEAFSESINALADSNAALKNTLSDIEKKANSTSNTDLLKKDINGILKKESDYERLTGNIRQRIEKEDSLDKLKDNLNSLQSKNDELQQNFEEMANHSENSNIKEGLQALREKNQQVEQKIEQMLENEGPKEQAKSDLGVLARTSEDVKETADELKKTLDSHQNKTIRNIPKIEDASGQMQDIMDDIDPKSTSSADRSDKPIKKPSDDEIKKNINDALKNNVDVPGLQEEIKDTIKNDIDKRNRNNSQKKDQRGSGESGKNESNNNNGANDNQTSAKGDKSNGDIAEKLKKFLDKANQEITSFKNEI